MKRVTGIGGIFFKAKDAPSLQAWYKRQPVASPATSRCVSTSNSLSRLRASPYWLLAEATASVESSYNERHLGQRNRADCSCR